MFFYSWYNEWSQYSLFFSEVNAPYFISTMHFLISPIDNATSQRHRTSNFKWPLRNSRFCIPKRTFNLKSFQVQNRSRGLRKTQIVFHAQNIDFWEHFLLTLSKFNRIYGRTFNLRSKASVKLLVLVSHAFLDNALCCSYSYYTIVDF